MPLFRPWSSFLSLDVSRIVASSKGCRARKYLRTRDGVVQRKSIHGEILDLFLSLSCIFWTRKKRGKKKSDWEILYCQQYTYQNYAKFQNVHSFIKMIRAWCDRRLGYQAAVVSSSVIISVLGFHACQGLLHCQAFLEDHRYISTDLGQLMVVIMRFVRRSTSAVGMCVDLHKGPTCRRVRVHGRLQ